MLGVLGFLWALPNTVIGLVLGALTFQAPRRDGAALVFDRRVRGLSWAMARFNRVAMTVGFVMISNVPVEGQLRRHEWAHVRQSTVWGPLFIPAYLALYVRYGYERHPFERAAMRSAGEIV